MDVANGPITIPVGGATGQYTVEWGDGHSTVHTGDAAHVYDYAGNYTVRIYGDFTRIRLADDLTSAANLRSIDQWGAIRWDTMESAFAGAYAMTYGATDYPNMAGVANMSLVFLSDTSFNGNTSFWNT